MREYIERYYLRKIFQNIKYNPHHDASGRFSTSDEAHSIVARDGTRTIGPKHPDNIKKGIVSAKYHSINDVPSIQSYVNENKAFSSVDGKGSAALLAIAKDQGFDGKPQVVDDLDQYVATGEPELFRGTKGEGYAEQLQSGDYFPGLGCYGNGTYMAYGPEAKNEARKYATTDGEIVRCTLHKDAKTINYNDLENKMTEYAKTFQSDMNKAKINNDTKEIERLTRLGTTVNDFGHFAAAQGYDAIVKEFKVLGADTGEKYYVVLNRTAMRIQKKILKGSSGYKSMNITPEISRQLALVLNTEYFKQLSIQERIAFVNRTTNGKINEQDRRLMNIVLKK
jgi:hypothetical protein